jgi:multidrug efflux pump subunit AcrB
MALSGTPSDATLARDSFKEQAARYFKAPLFEYRTTGDEQSRKNQRNLQRLSAIVGLLIPVPLVILAASLYKVSVPLSITTSIVTALLGGMAGLMVGVTPSHVQAQNPRVHNLVVGAAVSTPLALILMGIFGLEAKIPGLTG